MIRALATFAVIAVAALGWHYGATAKESSFSQIERGRYLATAGDCVSCHTVKGGKPFAGGRAIETPFGIIYSANITPDRETGIGAWDDADFYRAMHSGVDPHGRNLYPAFPYPYFTHVTREDVQAIRAYLETLDPVRNAPPRNALPWPLSWRFLLNGWNLLNFNKDTFKPDPSKSAQWNRGAYLVEGLGHCGACHTPKDWMGGDVTSRALQGGAVQDWFAPALTGKPRMGLQPWSEDDIVAFLKTGRNDRTAAYGPMAEVVKNSTAHLDDGDLHAMAAYLKSLAAKANDSSHSAPDDKIMTAGRDIYAANCSACHGQSGQGTPQFFPSLKGSAIVQSTDPTTVLHAILKGVHSVPTDRHPSALSMPAFDWKLSNAEIATVATFIRNSWGNTAPAVSAGAVKDLRRALHAKRIE